MYETEVAKYFCQQVSIFTTLYPGDIILTGTPPGVGAFMKPPQFLKVGDVVECSVEKIGTVVNKIVAESKKQVLDSTCSRRE